MTKSTITREQLLEIIETDHVQCGEASYLARMALAATDGEPYCKERKLFCSTDTARMRKVISVSAGTGDARLYRHAQHPVVPDEKPIPNTLSMYAVDAVAAIAEVKGWNACRAAMLAAAPHDTPALNSLQSVVTAQGKWIPVSERMPEDRKQVILWDAEIGEVTSGHYSHKTQTFYHCGDAIENEITHWMPPPCAPQEVK